MTVIFENLRWHTGEDWEWIQKRIDDFLQTDEPKRAIFNLNRQFGMEIHRQLPIRVIMRYDQKDYDMSVPQVR